MSIPVSLKNRCGSCLLFSALEGMADALVLSDPRGRVFHFNRRAGEWLGLDARRAIGASLGPLLKDPTLRRFWMSACREDLALTAEMPAAMGRVLRASVSPCRSATGEAIGRALLLRDVTGEKKIQVELSTAVARRLVAITRLETLPPAAAALTRREHEVLGHLAAGLDSTALAARLGVTRHTVASHLKNLYPKIKARNRSQAVAWALRHGLGPPERR